MKKELTLVRIDELANAIDNLVNMDISLSGVDTINIFKDQSVLTKASEPFRKTRDKLIEKYGDDNQSINPSSKNWDIFAKEMNKILEQTETVDIQEISLTRIAEAGVPLKLINVLKGDILTMEIESPEVTE